MSDDGILHGTRWAYNKGCHCDDCRAAIRKRMAEVRASAVASGFANWTHGRPGTYSAGCRCEPCRLESRRYMRLRRVRQQDAS